MAEPLLLLLQEVFDYLGLEQDWGAASLDLEAGHWSAQPGASVGRESGQLGELQLVHLPLGGGRGDEEVEAAAAGDTVTSAGSGSILRRRSITVASLPWAAAEDGEGEGAGEGRRLPGEPAPAPWVQQPSVLRWLRSQGSGGMGDSSLSLPLPPPRARGPVGGLSAVLEGVQAQHDDGTCSLPLPADPTRPALPRLAAAVAAAAAVHPTLSLPLPARLARPPIYRLAPGSADAQQAAAGGQAMAKGGAEPRPAGIVPGATASVTLKGAVALSSRQQLWQQSQQEAGGPADAAAARDPAAGPATQDDAISTHSGPSARHWAASSDQQRSGAGAGAPPPGAGGPGAEEGGVSERELLSSALENGVTYLIGHSKLRPAPGSNKFKVRPV